MADRAYEEFFKSSPDMFCVVGPEGTIRLANPSFERILGWTEDELIGKAIIEFVHPDDIESTRSELVTAGTGNGTVFFENRCRCSDGSYQNLHWSGVPQKDSGLLFAIARPTSGLLEASTDFRIILDASPAAIIMVDHLGSIRLVNLEVEKIFGYSRQELLGNPIEKLIPSRYHDQHENLRTGFHENLERRPMGHGRHLLGLHKSGKEFPVEIGLNPIGLEDGAYILVSVVDLTVQKDLELKLLDTTEELKKVNEQLNHLATVDELTGLLNRRGFNQQIDVYIRLMQRMVSPLSFMLIDLDNFKKLNDQFGHNSGDESLQNLAGILSNNLRVSDIVARYGGEEFAVILPSTDAFGALKLAEKLRGEVEHYPWKLKPLTISVGVSTMMFSSLEVAEILDYQSLLVSAADKALYQSKERGRNQVTHSSGIEKS